MPAAGAESPHLEAAEQAQAAQHSAPAALVIHEVIREDGEQELKKRPSAVAWSELAAGMSMGFSFLCAHVARQHDRRRHAGGHAEPRAAGAGAAER